MMSAVQIAARSKGGAAERREANIDQLVPSSRRRNQQHRRQNKLPRGVLLLRRRRFALKWMQKDVRYALVWEAFDVPLGCVQAAWRDQSTLIMATANELRITVGRCESSWNRRKIRSLKCKEAENQNREDAKDQRRYYCRATRQSLICQDQTITGCKNAQTLSELLAALPQTYHLTGDRRSSCHR
jgi:hypothetical protein